MITHLADSVASFPGPANQTRCFAHTLNLSAKAVLKQFDLPKANADEAVDEAAAALADLAKELEIEDRAEQEMQETNSGDEDDEPLSSWEDFREELTEEQVRELEVNVQPVRSMLAKVC
jgi:hypothetical protein